MPMYHNTTVDAYNMYKITDLNFKLSPYTLHNNDSLFNIECTFKDNIMLYSSYIFSVPLKLEILRNITTQKVKSPLKDRQLL